MTAANKLEIDLDAPAVGGSGHVTFEEWYATPVFEPGWGEQLETAATSGHAATRLAASLLLRAEAFLEFRRRPR